VLDGDQSGSGDPYFALLGTSRVVAFSPAGVGDNSVFLPSNAISAGEVLDEPGIAQGHNVDYLEISTATTVTDLISVQITTPGSGYIVVEADGMHGLISTGTDMNEAEFTIKDTPGGSLDFGNYYVSGFNNIAPSGLYRTSVSMRRTYFKGPGTYTFYFQARANNPSGTNYIWNPTITATYFPTSYGTVTAIASRAEAARDGLDGAAVSMRRGPGGERVAADAVKVDLSMLELRLAKMREATAQAEAELLRARFARSPEVKDANTSAAEVKQ
jgi:hypothetical protein